MNREKHEKRLKFIQENWSTKKLPTRLQADGEEENLTLLI